jgi:oligopeptide transport system ATP-binding protein
VATVLEVQDLRTHLFSREGVIRAVDGASFSLDEGEVMGIVGESGSGKSMTALSLMRLVPNPPGKIVGGRVVFAGRDLLTLSEAEMRRLRGNRLAMIFQDPMSSLNPTMIVGRQIAETMEVHLRLSRAEARRTAIELLEMVGIPSAERRYGDYPHQFSGGMRQRVMIAMAMACRPLLLLADEPTTALDVTVQAQILDVIRTMSREMGTAVILITHDLGVVAGLANKVAVMYAGRIVEAAPTVPLFSAPRHPYTLGLMTSIPDLEGETRTRLQAIPGLPPDLARLPEGCPFRPRCAFAMAQCTTLPPAREHGAGHTALCWLTEPPRSSAASARVGAPVAGAGS